MRINYFVGIEGTHGLAFKVLEMDPRTDAFETFMGPKARQRSDLPLEDILLWIFGPNRIDSEELSIGISKTGANGPLFLRLWNESPAGSRVFFFKSSDEAVNLDKHSSFLKIAPNRERIEMLTSMTDDEFEANPNAFQEATTRALTILNEVADSYSASAWAPLDINAFFGDPAAPGSSLLFRLAVKS